MNNCSSGLNLFESIKLVFVSYISIQVKGLFMQYVDLEPLKDFSLGHNLMGELLPERYFLDTETVSLQALGQ